MVCRPEQVVDSSGKLKYEIRDDKPVLMKLPAIDFLDDKDGKRRANDQGPAAEMERYQHEGRLETHLRL